MTTAAPATAPAAAPAAPAAAPVADTPAAAPAAAPTAAPAPESLFTATPAAAPAEPAAGDPPAWLPEKYRVNGADGKLDLSASSQKLAEGYAAAAKKIGTGDVAPESPDAYQFTPPEAYKDVQLDADLSRSFRERAHKAGLTQAQFEFVMGEYFEVVPSVLNGAAALSASEARTELQKVWKTTAEYEAGMTSVQRAISAAPAELQGKLAEKFGTDPVFAQFAALFGKEMREDRPPAPGGSQSGDGGIEALMKSEAYTSPKHPDHARVSQQVQQHFARLHGTAPAM